jgi:hypothetical protein
MSIGWRTCRQDRSDVLVLAAVAGMVDLMPLMIRVVSDLSTEADRADPLLRDGLSAVRAVASLREYAGQVGSRFVAPLIAHRQLTQDEVIEIGRLYGRIELLRTFIGGQMAATRASRNLPRPWSGWTRSISTVASSSSTSCCR